MKPRSLSILLLAAIIVAGCAAPLPAPILAPATQSAGPDPGPGPAGPALLDEAEVYAAVIRQVYTVDHTFGQPPNFPVIYLIGHTEAGPAGTDRHFEQPLRAAIVDALADLPARFIWVESLDEVPQNENGVVAGDGAVITVGNIEAQDDGTLHVAAGIYFAPLGAGGQTYVLEHIDGAWQVTGKTGPMWMS